MWFRMSALLSRHIQTSHMYNASLLYVSAFTHSMILPKPKRTHNNKYILLNVEQIQEKQGFVVTDQ